MSLNPKGWQKAVDFFPQEHLYSNSQVLSCGVGLNPVLCTIFSISIFFISRSLGVPLSLIRHWLMCVVQHSILTVCTLFSLLLIFSGGEKKSATVSSSVTSYTITGLPASSAYKIQVSSLLRDREGSSATVTARTRESTSLKKNLKRGKKAQNGRERYNFYFGFLFQWTCLKWTVSVPWTSLMIALHWTGPELQELQGISSPGDTYQVRSLDYYG